MKVRVTSTAGILGVIAFMFAMGAGWVMNILEIVNQCCEPLTGLMVIRIIGIFVAPLGAVLGYV